MTMMSGGVTSDQASGGTLSSIFDFLGSDTLNQALRTGSQYYLGQENIKGAQQLGRETQAGAQALAQEARQVQSLNLTPLQAAWLT